MSNNQNKLKEKLQQMKSSGSADKKRVIDGITKPEVKEPDFNQMAEELMERNRIEAKSVNDGHTKDTVYIRTDLYNAFNALVTRRGMKKELMNEAIADFVLKKYKEIQNEKK